MTKCNVKCKTKSWRSVCVQFSCEIQRDKYENSPFLNPYPATDAARARVDDANSLRSEPNHTVINNTKWKDLWGKDEPNILTEGEQLVLSEQRVCAVVSGCSVSVISAVLLGNSWLMLLMANRRGKFHLFLSCIPHKISLQPCFITDCNPNAWICPGSPLQTERGAKNSGAHRGSDCLN